MKITTNQIKKIIGLIMLACILPIMFGLILESFDTFMYVLKAEMSFVIIIFLLTIGLKWTGLIEWAEDNIL